MKLLYKVGSLLLAFGLPSLHAAQGNQGVNREHELAPRKSDGSVSFSSSFRHSNQFFDPGGSKHRTTHSTFPDGVPETYRDVGLSITGAYGFTDEISAWLQFPISYREETDSFNASDWGLGDVHAGARFLFWRGKHAQGAFDLSGKFPSGDTDIGPTGDDLPLGTGNTDIGPGLAFLQRLGQRFSIEEGASYTFRVAARVEYLQVIVPQDGSPIAGLPLGNMEIDWGDEMSLYVRALWSLLPRWTVGVGGSYFHRGRTEIVTTQALTIGSITDFTQVQGSLRSAQLIEVRPHLRIHLTPEIDLRAGADIPVWGTSYPQIPLVESLAGIRYELGLRYAF